MINRIFDATNRISTDGGSGFGGPGAHTAYSSINLGPDGGYQAGAIQPVSSDILYMHNFFEFSGSGAFLVNKISFLLTLL